MRPIKLTISAFGPYANKEVLELDKLGENGLYLITGTTGAGKTSIFDAIAYALYGDPSGDARDDSMFRSKYADESTETFVELEFICNEKLYKVRRNPEYTRLKTRGDGTTKQVARAELHYPDGKIVDKSKKEVTKAITEIIGVDFEQFTKIAMIAQGEFRKVLLDKTDNRKEIFRQIFKTSAYNTIQERIKEETSKIWKGLELARQSRITYAKGIVCDENNEQYELVLKAKNNELTTQEIIQLLIELVAKDEELNGGLAQKSTDIDKKLEKVSLSIGKAEEYAQSVETYNRKSAYLPIKAQECDEAKARLDEETAKKSDVEKIEREITLIEKEIPSYDTLDILQKEVEKIETAMGENGREKEICLERVNEKTKELKALKDLQKTLENASLKKEKLETEKTRLEEFKEKIDSLSEDVAKFVKLRNNLIATQEEYAFISENAKNLADEYNDLNKRFLDGQAGIMANVLRDGEPCPVCGSVCHPNKAKISAFVPSETDLKRAKKLSDEENKKAESKSADCARQKGQLDEFEKAIKEQIKELLGEDAVGRVKEVIKVKLAEIDETLKNLLESIKLERENVKEKARIDGKIPEEEKALEELSKKVVELEKTIVSDRATFNQKVEQIEKLTKELKFSSKRDADNALAGLKTQVKVLKTALEKAEREFNDKKSEWTKLQGEVSTLEKIIENVCEIDLETEKSLKITLLAEKRALQDEKEKVVSRINSNRTCLENIQKTAKESKELEEHYKWMNALSNTANGDISGKERISFETYVQMSYFERILRRANIRLQKMTGGQYDLIRRKDELGKRAQVGLDIDVLDHHNGTTRPVDSLSGGEQFKASLALALGLSDEIQSSAGGVRLDTMFIDEGFGSLDGESLQLAIATLQDLTEGNRLVGIISHVEELKNKIDKQILVEKQKVGGSRAKIISL